jgi:signal transduction histidine kinase
MEPLPELYVNPGLIKPLFFNLIGNALKYSKKNVAPVIKIYPEIANNDRQPFDARDKVKYCRIYIKDNGIGFEQQYAGQIFECSSGFIRKLIMRAPALALHSASK